MRRIAIANQKERDQMSYSILKYSRPMLTEVEDLEEAKEKALRFVTPVIGGEFIEIRDSDDQTVTIGYFDGQRFHWTRDKVQTQAWESCRFVIMSPLGFKNKFQIGG